MMVCKYSRSSVILTVGVQDLEPYCKSKLTFNDYLELNEN